MHTHKNKHVNMSAEHEGDKSLSKTKNVSFSGLCEDYCDGEVCLMSDEESFCEITTNEPNSISSSDNDNAEKLELVLQLAYACSPIKRKLEKDPVLRNSLLLWDRLDQVRR